MLKVAETCRKHKQNIAHSLKYNVLTLKEKQTI